MWIRRLTQSIQVVAVLGSLATPGFAQEGSTPTVSDSVLADLRSGTVETRRNAATRIRSSVRDTGRTALPVMIEVLMSEKDGQVRLAILDAVTELGPDAAPAVPSLLHVLRTNNGGNGREESHQDFRAALALAAIGKPAVEGLRDVLKEKKESVRAEAIMALGRIGPNAESAVPDLMKLLGDKSDRIGRDAAASRTDRQPRGRAIGRRGQGWGSANSSEGTRGPGSVRVAERPCATGCGRIRAVIRHRRSGRPP